MSTPGESGASDLHIAKLVDAAPPRIGRVSTVGFHPVRRAHIRGGGAGTRLVWVTL